MCTTFMSTPKPYVPKSYHKSKLCSVKVGYELCPGNTGRQSGTKDAVTGIVVFQLAGEICKV